MFVQGFLSPGACLLVPGFKPFPLPYVDDALDDAVGDDPNLDNWVHSDPDQVWGSV